MHQSFKQLDHGALASGCACKSAKASLEVSENSRSEANIFCPNYLRSKRTKSRCTTKTLLPIIGSSTTIVYFSVTSSALGPSTGGQEFKKAPLNFRLLPP